MTDRVLDAEKPEDIDDEMKFVGGESAREWYNMTAQYATRLYVEAAHEHPEVAEALLKQDDPDSETPSAQSAIRVHDPDRHEELMELDLSAYQGLSAEKKAASYLIDPEEYQGEPELWVCEECDSAYEGLPISEELTVDCPDCGEVIDASLAQYQRLLDQHVAGEITEEEFEDRAKEL